MNDRMPRTKRLWLLAALVVITGGWMSFDGAHALITGDFVTLRSGPYAGQLGPWAAMPRALGVDPRSPAVKWFFLLFGLVYLGALAAFLCRRGRPLPLTICAVIALLYVPFGTVASIGVLWVIATIR